MLNGPVLLLVGRVRREPCDDDDNLQRSAFVELQHTGSDNCSSRVQGELHLTLSGE